MSGRALRVTTGKRHQYGTESIHLLGLILAAHWHGVLGLSSFKSVTSWYSDRLVEKRLEVLRVMSRVHMQTHEHLFG
jgi:hypothetical protein